MRIGEVIKTHQQKIALSVGYVLVAILGIGLGRISAFKYSAPEIKITEEFSLPANYNSNQGTVQSASVDTTEKEECEGKIKGNISSSSKIYHVPGGSFYERTDPEMCFGTEAEAKAAGFRKSTR